MRTDGMDGTNARANGATGITSTRIAPGGGTAPGLSRRGMATLAITAVLCAALIALLAIRLSAAGRVASNLPPFPLVGHAAPAFAITPWNAQGATPVAHQVALESFAGHPVVLNFWGSWCAECAEEQPVLQAAWQKYHAQGVQFVGVAFQDHQQQGAAYLKQYGVTYPAGPAATERTAIDYSVTGAPETVFIARDGRVVSKYIGPIPDGTLDSTIQSLLTQ